MLNFLSETLAYICKQLLTSLQLLWGIIFASSMFTTRRLGYFQLHQQLLILSKKCTLSLRIFINLIYNDLTTTSDHKNLIPLKLLLKCFTQNSIIHKSYSASSWLRITAISIKAPHSCGIITVRSQQFHEVSNDWKLRCFSTLPYRITYETKISDKAKRHNRLHY